MRSSTEHATLLWIHRRFERPELESDGLGNPLSSSHSQCACWKQKAQDSSVSCHVEAQQSSSNCQACLPHRRRGSRLEPASEGLKSQLPGNQARDCCQAMKRRIQQFVRRQQGSAGPGRWCVLGRCHGASMRGFASHLLYVAKHVIDSFIFL